MRIGSGIDVHAFGPGDHVLLGGVRIAHSRGVVAHSDGDVLLHALCDALLGAAGLGDIGRHFPDTDPKYRGADSRALLREVANKLHEMELAVANIDATIIAEAPRMSPYIEAMVANLSADLDLAPGHVNVKAKTAERLGAIGRGEGIAAEAIVLLIPFVDISDPRRHPEAFAG